MAISEKLGIDTNELEEVRVLNQINGDNLNGYIDNLTGNTKAKARFLLDSSLTNLKNSETVIRLKIKSAITIFLLSMKVKISFFDSEDFEKLVNNTIEDYNEGIGNFHEIIIKLLKEKYGN